MGGSKHVLAPAKSVLLTQVGGANAARVKAVSRLKEVMGQVNCDGVSSPEGFL